MTNESKGRVIGRALVDATGGRPHIMRSSDPDETHHVDLAKFADVPGHGWTTWSTLNLSDVPNVVNGYDIRTELIGVCASEQEWFGNLLGTAGFCMMKDGYVAAPGHVFPDLVRGYAPATRLPHLFLTDPFEWPTLSRLDLPDGGAVHWLLAFPISEAERQYRREHGEEALGDLFADAEIDYYDVDRPSAV